MAIAWTIGIANACRPADGDRITRLHSEDELGSEMWRQVDLGPIGQDQSVDVAAGCQAVVPPIVPLVAGMLRGIVGRDVLRDGYAGSQMSPDRRQARDAFS